MWDLIVSVPDHCLSFYLEKLHTIHLAIGCFARNHNNFHCVFKVSSLTLGYEVVA